MNLKVCPHGHFYNADLHTECPVCEEEKTKPALVICEHGHVFDGSMYQTCPICEEKSKTVMVECSNGHLYDSTMYDSCPVCRKNGKHDLAMCENGHIYDRTIHNACPICIEKTKTAMIECENGHLYDSTLFDSCPVCAKNAAVEEEQKRNQLDDAAFFCWGCMRPTKELVCKVCGTELFSFRDQQESGNTFTLPMGMLLKDRYVIGAERDHDYWRDLNSYYSWDLKLNRRVIVLELYYLSCYRPSPTKVAFKATDQEEILSAFRQIAPISQKYKDLECIAQPLDYFAENNTLYIVWEQPVQSLAQFVLQDHGKFNHDELRNITFTLVEILRKVRAAGTVLYGFSPASILLMEDGSIQIQDPEGILYQIVSHIACEITGSLYMDSSGGFYPLESYPLYKAHENNVCSDIYSLCAVIYFCCTGKTLENAYERTASVNFESLDLPNEWKYALEKGLEIKPENRLQTLDEFCRLFFGEHWNLLF